MERVMMTPDAGARIWLQVLQRLSHETTVGSRTALSWTVPANRNDVAKFL